MLAALASEKDRILRDLEALGPADPTKDLQEGEADQLKRIIRRNVERLKVNSKVPSIWQDIADVKIHGTGAPSEGAADRGDAGGGTLRSHRAKRSSKPKESRELREEAEAPRGSEKRREDRQRLVGAMESCRLLTDIGTVRKRSGWSQ